MELHRNYATEGSVYLRSAILRNEFASRPARVVSMLSGLEDLVELLLWKQELPRSGSKKSSADGLCLNQRCTLAREYSAF